MDIPAAPASDAPALPPGPRKPSRRRLVLLALVVVALVGAAAAPFATGRAVLVRSDETWPGTFALFPNPNAAPFGLSDNCAARYGGDARDLLPAALGGDHQQVTMDTRTTADALYQATGGDARITVHRYTFTDEARAAVARAAGTLNRPQIIRLRLDARKYWIRDYVLYNDDMTTGRSGIIYNCAEYLVQIDARSATLRDAYARAAHDRERGKV